MNMVMPMALQNFEGKQINAVQVKNMNFKIDSKKISISLDGSILADIADAFIWAFQSLVVGEINKAINSELPSVIADTINDEIKGFRGIITLYNYITLDISNTAVPKVSDTQLALFFNATIYHAYYGYKTPSTPISDLSVDITQGNI